MSLGSFVTGRSEIGEPYYMGITSPDSRFTDDLNAIDTYVREEARTRLAKFPKSLSVIEDYERWRQGLGYYDLNVMPNDTMKIAKAKLAAINSAQKNVLPSSTKVEEGSFITAPEDTTKNISPVVKVAIFTGVGVASVILLAIGLSKLHPISIAQRMSKGF